MDDKELARAVALDLGSDVVAALEGRLPDEGTRTFGLIEAVTVAAFLVQCAQLVLQMRSDGIGLVPAVANSRELMQQGYPGLSAEKRLGLVARILKKLLPDTFTLPARDRSAAGAKTSWIASYFASLGGNQPPVLVPFASGDFWIVDQPVGWMPDASDGPGVVRVDVPRGFVTDLGSVPSYLWALLQQAGHYGEAVIYHDWLYWEQSCAREVADRVLDRALHDLSVDSATHEAVVAGVRLFGGSYWAELAAEKAAGGKRLLRRLPDEPTMTWDEWRRRPGVFA
jgi:Protein of unknown function (DUF1353)